MPDEKKVYHNDGKVSVQKGQNNLGRTVPAPPPTSQAKPPKPTPPKDER